jgi:cobalt-zinc-cadmium efflux system membrane fusion protein
MMKVTSMRISIVCITVITLLIFSGGKRQIALSETPQSEPSDAGDPHGHDQHAHNSHSHDPHAHGEDHVTTIPTHVATESGVLTERVQSREIRATKRVVGRIVPSEHRLAHVIPRYSGIVREGRKHIGDKVEKNEVIAVLESNQSLQPFEVRSQIAGRILQGHVVVGEFIPENQWIYVIGDLSEVWVDLAVPLVEGDEITLGQSVSIFATHGKLTRDAIISYIAPYADEHTQARLVRVVLRNEDGVFPPGMHVAADVVIKKIRTTTAVRESAVQRMNDTSVIFIKTGEKYTPRQVSLGVTDGEWVECISGIHPGEEYVSQNSFLIKSDLLKSGAEHDH